MCKVLAHIFFDVLSLAPHVVTTIWHEKSHFGSWQAYMGIGTAVANSRAFAERPKLQVVFDILIQEVANSRAFAERPEGLGRTRNIKH